MNLKHLLLLIFCVGLFNCETESTDPLEPEMETDNTLIKRIVFNEGTSDEYTEVYSYTDGNKLMSVDDGFGFKNEFTYDGDFLVKDNAFINGELAASVDIVYNSDEKIASYTETFFEPSGLDDRKFRNDFTYNNDGTLTNKHYVNFSNSGFELDYTETIILDGNGKNIIEISDNDDYKVSYTYDDKNNAFKNIHAIEVLNILGENEFGAIIYGNTNNIISLVENGTPGSGLYNDKYEYTYNENNYPKTCIYKSSYDGVPEDIETLTFYYE